MVWVGGWVVGNDWVMCGQDQGIRCVRFKAREGIYHYTSIDMYRMMLDRFVPVGWVGYGLVGLGDDVVMVSRYASRYV